MIDDEPAPMATGAEPASAERETQRLEAFSDGVMAVIITIMAFELHTPLRASVHALGKRLPALLIYLLSFTFIGIYWNNHHHLLRAARRVSAAVMWGNLHLLFWLSLIPVCTEWIGEDYRHSLPAAAYGVVCFGSAVAFSLLVVAIVRTDGRDSVVARAIGSNLKGRVSLLLYAVGVALAALSPYASYAVYAVVALIWFIPDRRLERR